MNPILQLPFLLASGVHQHVLPATGPIAKSLILSSVPLTSSGAVFKNAHVDFWGVNYIG